MKILIYNDNLGDLEYLYNIVDVMHLNIIADKKTDFESFFNVYNKNSYDIVFIEYSINIWEELVTPIVKVNPAQKIILISNEYGCSGKNCLPCKEKHNVHIVIKPILNTEIMNLFSKKFKCEEYSRSKLEFNLLTISKKMNFNYGSIDFNRDTYSFEFDNINETKKIMILTDLVSELKNIDIKYKVNENLNVSILDER